MGGSRAWASAFGALFALAAPTGACAQGLPLLHVKAFVLTSDNAHPRPEEAFHIIVDVLVREHVGNLDRVVLPTFGPLEIVGDEKRVSPVRGGSEYREIVGVVAHLGSRVIVPPAYLDAIDARDGKPKRFLSNSVVVEVQGEPVRSMPSPVATLWSVAWFVLGISAIALVVVLGLIVRRAPPAAPVLDASATAPVAHPNPPLPDAYDSALRELRAHPSREAAMKVREHIWASIGATPYETLGDVLRRRNAHAPHVRFVLRALERAAFTHDGDLPAAIADAIAALQGYRT